jgi:hypothetical protein
VIGLSGIGCHRLLPEHPQESRLTGPLTQICANITLMNLNPRERECGAWGAVDGGCRITRTSITLNTEHWPDLLAKLHDKYGGSIVGHRWVLRTPSKRLRFLRAWHDNTYGREAEIKAAMKPLRAELREAGKEVTYS